MRANTTRKFSGRSSSFFGYGFIKFEPNDYIIQYSKGKLVREGVGLSFWYYAPNTSIIKVPTTVQESNFMFEQITMDYQAVSIQGSVSYRIVEPKKIAEYINYAITHDGRNYVVGEQNALENKIKNAIIVSANNVVSSLELTQAITGRDKIKLQIMSDLKQNGEMIQIGVEIVNLSLLAIKPSVETSRALEAQVREKILQESDDAIYIRRNASIDQERIVKENEYNTEIAIEEKKIEIEEKKLEAKRKLQQKQNLLKLEQVNADIELEEKKSEWMKISAENLKMKADAKAYELKVMMKSIEGASEDTLHALTSLDMNSSQLIANAFRELAKKAGQIGNLNVSPDLLKELL